MRLCVSRMKMAMSFPLSHKVLMHAYGELWVGLGLCHEIARLLIIVVQPQPTRAGFALHGKVYDVFACIGMGQY